MSASDLEARFLFHWRALGGPELAREQRFHPRRKWRLDFAHRIARIGIEVQGGIHSNGRHVRGVGYERDCEKYNAAMLRGWQVFLLTPAMIDNPAYIEALITHVSERSAALKIAT